MRSRSAASKFNTGTLFEKVEQDANGAKVTLADGKVFEAEIFWSLLVVAETANMGYEEQGIPMDRGFVLANERLHTGVGNIYAVGDIVPAFSWLTAVTSRASSLQKRSLA